MNNNGALYVLGELYGKLIKPCGEEIDLGLLSSKLITDAFAEYYIDQLQGLVNSINLFKYHDSGTGTTVETVQQTGLIIPTGISRVVGTQVEGATAKVYKTVGLITYDGAYDITEWGLFNGASGSTMMDRALFTAVTVALNYQLEFTYNHTALSGG